MTSYIYSERIEKVQKRLKDGEVLIVFAASHLIRNRDVEYKFRQDSDYYYLTGIEESDGILILKNSYKSIFVLPKDKDKEIWTGIRIGKEKAKELLGLDESFDTNEWESKLDEILLNQHTLFHFFGKIWFVILNLSNGFILSIKDPEKASSVLKGLKFRIFYIG